MQNGGAIRQRVRPRVPCRPTDPRTHTPTYTRASARLKRKWRVKLPKIASSAVSVVAETAEEWPNILSPIPQSQINESQALYHPGRE